MYSLQNTLPTVRALTHGVCSRPPKPRHPNGDPRGKRVFARAPRELQEAWEAEEVTTGKLGHLPPLATCHIGTKGTQPTAADPAAAALATPALDAAALAAAALALAAAHLAAVARLHPLDLHALGHVLDL